MKLKKRIAALLMAGAMVCSTLPVNALAVENSNQNVVGLCEHHTEHNADCGYTEGIEGTPCNHEHTEDCYTLVTECVHEHTEDCYPEESVSDHTASPSDAENQEPENCIHECSEDTGCIKKELACKHEHDEACGYAPAEGVRLPQITVAEGTEHTEHPICGATCTDGEDHSNVTWEAINDATGLENAQANGHYYLTQDVTLTDTWTPANGVVLCLNSHSITANGNFAVITVKSGVTFTLTDCKETQGKITHGMDKAGRGVYVATGSTFTMSGGTITGNTTSDGDGGGVYVYSGTFTMNGEASITCNGADGGGGVFVGTGSTFNMSGGASITDNDANYCGGVYVTASGTFNMNGGSITNNTASSNGGGVYVYNGTFTMNGGSITDNTASDNGGGVYMTYSTTYNATFNLYGGKITNNKANEGGGVYVGGGGTFTVSGAVNITGNKKGDGNKTGGDTTNNVYLSSGKFITIGESGLTDGASIGVTTAEAPTDEKSIQIATGATGDLNYNQIFTPDVANADYVVTKDENGYLYLYLYLSTHQHIWTYKASDATITATCKKCQTNGGSVTINAPTGNLEYDKTPKVATLDNKLTTGDSEILITYKNKDTNIALDAAPTDAGEYIASITLTGTDGKPATASVTYEIAKATPTPDLPTGLTATYGDTLANVELPTGWKWDAPNTSVGNVGENSFSATYTPTDTSNYNTATTTLTVTVKAVQAQFSLTPGG